MKEKYIQFIKQHSKINITQLCKELGIDKSNVLNGRSSEKTTRLLYDTLRKRLKELLEGE